MRFLFVSHYFHPEVGAPQTRILETAHRLAANGHAVTVLTGFPNYPDGIIPPEYRRQVLKRERIGSVEVIRAAVYPAPNSGFARRLANHASFATSSLLAAPFARRPDVVVAESPPLFTAVSGVLIARGFGAPLILNVADLWPESAVQLGVLSNPRAIRAAEVLERFAYRHAAAITVPTAGMRASLLDRGEPATKVEHLPNAVDVDRFSAVAPPDRDDRRPPKIIYCGTVGLAQEVGTIVDAVEQLTQSGSPVELLVVGDGAERQALADRVAAHGPPGVRFAGRVARDEVPTLIGSSDAAVLSLRDVPLFEDALPTKMLEYMAAGLPVVASAAGEAARVLRAADAGVACRPGDAAALADALRAVTADDVRARAMGDNGRRFVRERYSRAAFVGSVEAIARRVTGDERERDRVRLAYSEYASSHRRRRAWNAENPGNRQIIARLYDAVASALRAADAYPDGSRVVLDLGCGYGDLLGWLASHGAPPASLIGIDLLEERIVRAREVVPGARFETADARALPLPDASVDAVVMSTVLSSIVSPAERDRVAAEAVRVLRPGGVILSYDLRLWSPRNRNVRAIDTRELARLFPKATITTRSLTLLPPLARTLRGATDVLYGPLVAIAPLRSHLLAAITPAPSS